MMFQLFASFDHCQIRNGQGDEANTRVYSLPVDGYEVNAFQPKRLPKYILTECVPTSWTALKMC